MIITVQCPACETSFPVDPNKVPEGGVKVRCSSCAEIFFVDKPAIPSVADLAPEPAEMAAAAAAATAAAAAAGAVAAATVDPPADPPAGASPEGGPSVHADSSSHHEIPAQDEVPAHHEVPAREAAPAYDAAATHDAAVGQDETADPVEAAFEEQSSEDHGMDVAEPPMEGAWEDVAVESEVEVETPWDSDDALDSDGADAWGDEMDMLDADAPEAEYGDDHPDEQRDEPQAERLETVEDVTRAAAADYPRDDSFDATDDWAEATPAAEAPVADREAPAAEMSSRDAEAPDGAGVTLEVAAPPAPETTEPPAPAPAPGAEPAKFQFGRRDPHDKARRLARVLVSDIITYNPDRHQRALEQATLHADFEDEIRKSWAEYVEQVGRDLAESTPYWFDALNEILARGQKVF